MMITLKNVTKEYNKGNIGLEDVSLDIAKGEFVFIVGKSGSGKTTLMKLLQKELDVTSGQIIVNGQDYKKLTQRNLPKFRRQMGMVFQDFRLLKDRTIFENVAFAQQVVEVPHRYIKRQVENMLEMVGLKDRMNAFPNELSGGEQQRVAIARALVNHPVLLLADEPTGNLDPVTAKGIMELLSEINKSGTTVLVVTHNKELVNEMGKRVILIEDGHIEQSGIFFPEGRRKLHKRGRGKGERARIVVTKCGKGGPKPLTEGGGTRYTYDNRCEQRRSDPKGGAPSFLKRKGRQTMGVYSKEDIIRIVREEEIEFVRLQFTDIFGMLKNVAITASQIEKAVSNQCMFDGSSIEGFVRIDESDQYLYPDLKSFRVFPWRPSHGKVARLICDVYNTDGTPFVGDPRYVLKRVIQKANDMGYDRFNVGPEAEFFLFKTDEEGKPTTQTNDEAGYFDLGPLDHGESTRREICMALEQMDFEIEASHHECAQGQHEIDFKYAEALHAADNIMTFKLAVKTLAQRNGLHATFMPKPIFGIAGSGMHTNMSLFRNGKNAFYDPDDPRGLSKEAYSFIAGLLHHVRGMAAVTNPLVNSYKRLVPGYEAPCYLAWSASNRSALIRIPASRGQGTRILSRVSW